MAQYFWQPDAADAGSPPSNMDFATDLWVTGLQVLVEMMEDSRAKNSQSLPSGASDDDMVLELMSSSNARRLLSIHGIEGEDIGTPSDVEIYIYAAYMGFASGAGGPVVRASGSENGYGVPIMSRDNDNTRITRYTNGAFTQLALTSLDVDYAFYHHVGRAIGTTLRTKAWRHDVSEPVDWQNDVTDSDHEDGRVGILKFGGGNVQTMWVRGIGVGTNGDVAPRSATVPDLDEAPFTRYSRLGRERSFNSRITR